MLSELDKKMIEDLKKPENKEAMKTFLTLIRVLGGPEKPKK